MVKGKTVSKKRAKAIVEGSPVEEAPVEVPVATPATQVQAPVIKLKPKKVEILYIATNDINARLEIAEANIQTIADYLNK